VEVGAAAGAFDSGRFGLAVSFINNSQIPGSLIDSVLSGPYESLTADQIAQLFQETGDFSVVGQVPGSQLATAVALVNTRGFAHDTRFQAVADGHHMPPQGYYSFQAPAVTGGGPLVFTAALDLAVGQGHGGRLDLLDAAGNVVPSVVLMDAAGVDTIRATGLTPGATYFLQVSMPGDSAGGGNAVLVADFLQSADVAPTLKTGTLGAAGPQATSTLYVARSQYFQFQLSASATSPDDGDAVQMTILDQKGNVVLQITAQADGRAAVGSVLLTPGEYTVEFSALAEEDDSSPDLTYSLQGGAISDPIGVIVHNPTYTPIYKAPTRSKFTYLYPNGTFSMVPFLWLCS
jgi:hypothetical protein